MQTLRFLPRLHRIIRLSPCSQSPRPRAFPQRQFTTSHIRTLSAIPYTPTCPPSTCICAPTPDNLDIDRTTPLLNTMAPYAQHVVICSGQPDWTSRIEDEQSSAGDFMRGLRGVVGREGKRFDPFNNIVATMSSFPAASSKNNTSSMMLFPSFQRIDNIPHDSTSLTNLATAYLSATTLHPFHKAANLTPEQEANLIRDPSLATNLPTPSPIEKPVILICGHGGRDERCGILGPLLQGEFKNALKGKGIDAHVGTISHIGGHKFAGNVIIYLPPSWSQLSGTGLWYGRVGPEQVDGIIEETILGGRLVADLFRGGITMGGVNLGRVLEEQLKRDNGGEKDAGLRLKPRARASG
ncbi:hypothetical protein K504DRAFT_480820 [Pleomassaria siparia CBS 279.74]|uniref:Altered inheritance of mitochondria protein 32 n=1 Tax=Pleomassaria siparia CBS 279.74 TaxID=1314801 RepID=A0A6G1KEA4_9PLEO|nr:hypothetical protein K504DRAFT_480820 [Pleomassaria siparia CBS 279.74]